MYFLSKVLFKSLRLMLCCFSAFVIAKDNVVDGSSNQVRPNFVWLVSEDNNRDYMRLYKEGGARMPNVEQLAANGLVFNQAFSNSPVCSTARTTLALGLYPTMLGMGYHRPYQTVPLPEGVKPISQWMTEAGYYTSNNVKEDYNFVEPDGHWHRSAVGADWRGRKAEQAFFHMQSWNTTHEHKLHFPVTDVGKVDTKYASEDMKVAPIYPNTETFRYTKARYLEQHEKIDAQIGEVIEKLRDDGVLEDTFIMYFGDHGGVLPGTKGYINERGLAVPLVVRVPKHFEHLVHNDFRGGKGLRVDGVVSFIDFAPTLLQLAGIDAAQKHIGKPFLGDSISLAALNNRNETYGFADRFDEKYDMVRSIRLGPYKYVRHFLPFNPDGLYARYRYKQAAFNEWYDMFKRGKLNDEQSSFFKVKSAEALYDLVNDPYETNNLADDRAYAKELITLRTKLHEKLASLPDLAVLPEKVLMENVAQIDFSYAREQQPLISALLDIAQWQLLPWSEVEHKIKLTLVSDKPWHRYWALNVALSFGKQAKSILPLANSISRFDSERLNRGRALQLLSVFGQGDVSAQFERILAADNNTIEDVYLLNMATQMKQVHGIPFDLSMKPSWQPPPADMKDKDRKWRLESVHNWLVDRIAYLTSN